jgi:hypothetical protein
MGWTGWTGSLPVELGCGLFWAIPVPARDQHRAWCLSQFSLRPAAAKLIPDKLRGETEPARLREATVLRLDQMAPDPEFAPFIRQRESGGYKYFDRIIDAGQAIRVSSSFLSEDLTTRTWTLLPGATVRNAGASLADLRTILNPLPYY